MATFESVREDIAAKLDTLKEAEVQIPTVINEIAGIIAEASEISVVS